MFNAVIIFLFSIAAVYAQDPVCENGDNLQKEMFACLAKSPSLIDIVPRVAKNTTTAFEIACGPQEAIVTVLECVTKIGVECLPKEVDVFKHFIPSKENWQNALAFVCSHRTEMIEAISCLVTVPQDGLTKCMQNRLQAFRNLESREDKIRFVCGNLNVKTCIQSAKGSCLEKALSLETQLFEKIVPLDKCKPSSSATSFMPFSYMGFYGLSLMAMWLC